MSLTGSQQTYPLNYFYQTEQRVAQEIIANTKAPDALVGMAMLKGMVMSCQGGVVVELPTGSVKPVVMNFLMLGISGERKSEVEAPIFKPFFEADALREAKYKERHESYMASMRLWKLKDDVLSGQYKAAIRYGEETESIERALALHEKAKPQKPRLRRFIRNDASERAIMDALHGNYESIMVAPDEGDVAFKSGLFDHVGKRNSEWSGATTSIDRKGESLVATNPRVSIALSLQPDRLQDYLARHGKAMRGSGHWARYLVGYPASTQGTRYVTELPVWRHIYDFQARIADLIADYDQKMDAGQMEPIVIKFSEEALLCWFQMVNRTESWLLPCGYLSVSGILCKRGLS